MCHPARCRTCGKTTWSGCGQHVNQVMRNVPPAERCPGHSAAERTSGSGGSLFDRILGRRRS